MSSGLGFGPRGVASRLQALGAKWLLWCSTPLLSHGGGAAAGLRELYAADCYGVRRRRPDLRASYFLPQLWLGGGERLGMAMFMVHGTLYGTLEHKRRRQRAIARPRHSSADPSTEGSYTRDC